jgi:hypothetical protein
LAQRGRGSLVLICGKALDPGFRRDDGEAVIEIWVTDQGNALFVLQRSGSRLDL